MSKSRTFINEETTRNSESPAHKKRREEQQRLQSLIHMDDLEDADDDTEFDTFERIQTRAQRRNK